jgi:hypothetical protein
MKSNFDTCALPNFDFEAYVQPKREIIDFNVTLAQNARLEKRSDKEWATIALEYRDVTSEIKALEKRQKLLRDALITMSDQNNATGAGILVEQCVRKGSVKYADIAVLQDIDLDQYRDKHIVYWKISEI